MKQHLRTLLYAVLAGFCIGLGGTAFLRLKDAFTGGNVVGAIVFTVGLFTICTRGYNLFTGKACALFDNPPSYAVSVAEIWVGNLIGCGIFAGCENLTTICGGETGLDAVAGGLVAAKMSAPLLSLFILGIICNMCIYIAVNGYATIPHETGKYLALFLGVTVFIFCGTEHSIADMYYWCVSGVIYQAPAQSLLRLLVITAGNIVGGVLIPQCEKLGKLLQE